VNRRARRIIRKAARVRSADARRLGRVLPRITVRIAACIAALEAIGRAFADITREARRMTEQEKCCGTCAMVNGDEECRNRKPTFYCTAWTPKAAPQPAPALLTLERVDRWIQNHHQQPAIIAVTGAEDIIVAVCPLLEAEECKAAIEAAGCWWTDGNLQTIEVGDGHTTEAVATWPEARAWAEAQAAKREEDARAVKAEWSEPIDAMDADLLSHTFEAIGGTSWYPDSVQPCMAVPRAFLRGWARAKGRYDASTDRVWLGKGDMPQTT